MLLFRPVALLLQRFQHLIPMPSQLLAFQGDRLGELLFAVQLLDGRLKSREEFLMSSDIGSELLLQFLSLALFLCHSLCLSLQLCLLLGNAGVACLKLFAHGFRTGSSLCGILFGKFLKLLHLLFQSFFGALHALKRCVAVGFQLLAQLLQALTLVPVFRLHGFELLSFSLGRFLLRPLELLDLRSQTFGSLLLLLHRLLLLLFSSFKLLLQFFCLHLGGLQRSLQLL
mmetsp:Transcript_44756/g.97265  ORF Transcript_44756/g.97265 Transcript_44756/m.97265 type:complete len:228 (+) Transcript_44756:305-988(+)